MYTIQANKCRAPRNACIQCSVRIMTRQKLFICTKYLWILWTFRVQMTAKYSDFSAEQQQQRTALSERRTMNEWHTKTFAQMNVHENRAKHNKARTTQKNRGRERERERNESHKTKCRVRNDKYLNVLAENLWWVSATMAGNWRAVDAVQAS